MIEVIKSFFQMPPIHHDRQADDIGRSLEITEWISHPQALRNPPRRLKSVYSDTALPPLQINCSLATPGVSIHDNTPTEAVAEC